MMTVAGIILVAIIIFILAFVPTCSHEENDPSEGATHTVSTEFMVKLDEILFIAGTGDARLDEDQAVKQIESWGGFDVSAQSDGSYTATFSTKAYNELKQSLKDDLDKCIEGASKGDYPDVVGASFEKSYEHIEVVAKGNVDLKSLTAPRELGMKACMYRAVAGEQVTCTVDVVDESGKKLGTLSYPEQG